MRLQLHRASGQTELVRTSDVSRGGLSFISQQVYRVGEEVGFILPFGGQKEPVETRGRIAWARQTLEGWAYGVGFAADATVPARPSDRTATPPVPYGKSS